MIFKGFAEAWRILERQLLLRPACFSTTLIP